jgi:hypothetical protein
MDTPERERRERKWPNSRAQAVAGRPALNFERIYGTTVSAKEVARALADHFRAQEFEAQVYRTSENRTVMQARKESLWVTYALTVVITPGEGQLSISLGVTSGSMPR